MCVEREHEDTTQEVHVKKKKKKKGAHVAGCPGGQFESQILASRSNLYQSWWTKSWKDLTVQQQHKLEPPKWFYLWNNFRELIYFKEEQRTIMKAFSVENMFSFFHRLDSVRAYIHQVNNKELPTTRLTVDLMLPQPKNCTWTHRNL